MKRGSWKSCPSSCGLALSSCTDVVSQCCEMVRHCHTSSLSTKSFCWKYGAVLGCTRSWAWQSHTNCIIHDKTYALARPSGVVSGFVKDFCAVDKNL